MRNAMTLWTILDFSLSTFTTSLLFANLLLIVLLLIKRWTTNDLFQMIFRPLTAATILICLVLGAAVIAYAIVTGTIPTTPESPLDSLLKFFPRLAAMSAGMRLVVDVIVFACLLITPIWICRHYRKGQTTAREHRDFAQHKFKKANSAAYEAIQRENELKAKCDGLQAGYCYIMGNDKVPKAVKEEFSKRIHEAETASRRTLAKQKKQH